MIDSDAEVTLSGDKREHLVRLAFAFDIGTPARITGGPSSRSVAEYDCGERGGLFIKSGIAILERDGKTIRERPLSGPWTAVLIKLRADRKLDDLLYNHALEALPHE